MTEHPIDPEWRQEAAALQAAYARAVAALLAHIEDNIDLATHAGDEEVVASLMSTRGLMRSRYKDYLEGAEKLGSYLQVNVEG